MSYPLLPYSQLVFDLLRTNPDVYWTCFCMRLDKKKVDVGRLKRAMEQAIRNHPVFSMRVDGSGQQRYEPRPDMLHGQYYSVDFVEDGRFVDVRVRKNRILGDGRSDRLIVEDVMRAYCNLPLEHDDYLDYLQRVEQERQSPRYQRNRQWLESEYGQLSCPVHPVTDVPVDMADVSEEGMLTEDYSPMRSDLNRLGEERLVTLTAFFSLASALAMMEYNDCNEAALTWAYEGREGKEEQRICGSLHRDVPFKMERGNNRQQLLDSARNRFRAGIAHSGYPFTLVCPHTDIWNYALNVLEQSSMQAKMTDVPFPFEVYEPEDAPHVAYSLMDVEIYNEERLLVMYRYSATHYKESSVRRFAALVRKYAGWLLEDEG